MSRWLVRRIIEGALTWGAAVVALFLLVRLLPGDPLAAAHDLPPETRAALARLYGLDQPLTTQLGHFLAGLVRGDLGESFLLGRPVLELIGDRLPATLLLGGTVLAAEFLIAWWLGTRLAAHAGCAGDRWAMRTLLTGHALPPFWLGLILVWIFALLIRWLPAGGVHDPLLAADAPATARLLDTARHLALPWVTLLVTTLVVPLRHHREAVREMLDADWVRAARARGMPEGEVLRRHAARPALTPLLTLLGLWIPMLLTGSVLVEATFAWPGLGLLMAEAVGGRDYPLATGCVILGAAAVVAGNILSDVLQRLLDPRVGNG
ncbi:MAG TPA: ABC transporter permease [Gemmatimonadales bacterium]|nr:ABC transporter permease [Gemmatimonadales bacterium]